MPSGAVKNENGGKFESMCLDVSLRGSLVLERKLVVESERAKVGAVGRHTWSAVTTCALPCSLKARGQSSDLVREALIPAYAFAQHSRGPAAEHKAISHHSSRQKDTDNPKRCILRLVTESYVVEQGSARPGGVSDEAAGRKGILHAANDENEVSAVH